MVGEDISANFTIYVHFKSLKPIFTKQKYSDGKTIRITK
jgi:hypothetical protein